MAIDCDAPDRGRSPTMKALLVGIGYHDETVTNPDETLVTDPDETLATDPDETVTDPEETVTGLNETEGSTQALGPILTSIPNVEKLSAFLRGHWKQNVDITVMTDEDGVEETLRPTRANLLHEIKALVHGVKPGDRRLFYFAGHSGQLPCRSDSEEDGMDEALITVDGLKVRDNTLHDLLVKDLPNGSSLTAIFDSCHSGTMLDLKHYKCNGVYYPWVNKGKRSSRTLRNGVVRRDGRVTTSEAPSKPASKMGSGGGNFCSPSIFGAMQNETPSPPSSDEDLYKHGGGRCMSPERRFCDGFCRDKIQGEGTLPHANVISISSSNDGQTSWDAHTGNGDIISMTSSLVKILEQHPLITYADLMNRLNHEVHSYTVKMHRTFRKKRCDCRRANGKHTDRRDTEPEEDKGEIDNFQDLQLGSLRPINMKDPFVL